MGDGGPHDPQIHFEADNTSCMWNGFPICIDATPLNPNPPSTTVESKQVSSFVTDPGLGCFGPGPSVWPPVYIYDYLDGILAGYSLQLRVRFFATGGGTSVGSVGIATPVGSCDPAIPGPIIGAFDSGFFDISCVDCTIAVSDVLSIIPCFTNFSPLGGVVQIDQGILDVVWVASGSPEAAYDPFQDFGVKWVPPCGDPDAGLFISLETDSCGELVKTYQNVADEVNALNLGITATILGSHGSDIAAPDPACPAPDYCCDMTGAECSGGVHDSQ